MIKYIKKEKKICKEKISTEQKNKLNKRGINCTILIRADQRELKST